MAHTKEPRYVIALEPGGFGRGFYMLFEGRRCQIGEVWDSRGEGFKGVLYFAKGRASAPTLKACKAQLEKAANAALTRAAVSIAKAKGDES